MSSLSGLRLSAVTLRLTVDLLSLVSAKATASCGPLRESPFARSQSTVAKDHRAVYNLSSSRLIIRKLKRPPTVYVSGSAPDFPG